MSAHRTAVSALRLLLPLLLLACARGHSHGHNHGHGHGHGHGHHHPPTPTPAVIDADAAAAAVSAWSGSGQVTAPYPEGTTLGLGSGFDVTGWGAVKQTGAIDSGTATATTSFQNTVSATKFLATAGTDINTKLSISSQASMSYGAFSANTDVSFTRQIDRSARSFTYLSEYSIQFGQLLYSAQPTLSATAMNLLKSQGVSAFVTAYGQYYAYAITSGSRLLARSSVSTSSEEMTTALSVSVSASGSYGAFSASVTANVQNDESIQTFTTTQQDAITYQGVDLTCMGGGPPSSADGGAAQDPTPDAMDALITKYQSCVASVASSPGAGIPVQVVLARFDELPDWLSNGFPAIVTNNSILVDNSALADAATLVNHYDGIYTDSTAYLAQGGVPPATATALQALNSAIRASRAQVLAGLTLSEADLETLLATLPFWGTYQTTYNRLIGDFRWSSCDWNKVQNPGPNGDSSTQQCPSTQTVPIVGGTVCRPSWDTMLMYSYGTPAATGQPAGWYSQCMNHDNDALSAGQSLFLSCCYAPLLGSCSPVASTNSATLSCPSQSQVLIGLGGTCNQGYDAMLYQLEPASTYSANGQCMNHHNDAQSNPSSMTGYCCSMPLDATARYVQVTGDGTNPSTVSCNANEVLVNGGTTCPRSADQFILQSYPSSLSTWSGYCINHQNSGLQGPPVSSSAVCVSFAEDQAPTLDDSAPHGHRHSGYGGANNAKPKAAARATVQPVSYNVTANAPTVPGHAVGAPALATVSATAPQQLVHYALNPPPLADLTIAYRTTCNVELGARGNVRVASSGRCVHDTVSGTITVPRGASFASVQVLRPGGPRWQAVQHGVVEFVGRVKSEDVMWRRPASIFTPIRVVIKH